jgi:hypothetical protein
VLPVTAHPELHFPAFLSSAGAPQPACRFA